MSECVTGHCQPSLQANKPPRCKSVAKHEGRPEGRPANALYFLVFFGSGGRERSHLCVHCKVLKNKRLSFVDPWVMPQWCGITLCRTVLLRKRTKGLPETSLFHRYVGHGYDTSDRILRNSSSCSRGASMARQDRRKFVLTAGVAAGEIEFRLRSVPNDPSGRALLPPW